MPDKIHYPGGASRSNDAEDCRFDLMPPRAHVRHAQRWARGAQTHGANNWRKGMPVAVIVNHMEKHLQLWKNGDRTDDHMAAIAWATYALMECEEHGWTEITGQADEERESLR